MINGMIEPFNTVHGKMGAGTVRYIKGADLHDAIDKYMFEHTEIPALTNADVGQTIVVTAVDENGRPIEWEAVDFPEQAQANWDQNDDSNPDFVKNRPFYEKIDSVTLMPETQFSNLTHIYSPEISTPSDVNGDFISDFTFSSNGTQIINEGDSVKVTFDGTVYECVLQNNYIGNQSLTSYAETEDTGEPFLFSLQTIPSFHTKSTDCVVKVEADISHIKKIDSKFLELPIAPGSGTNSTIENCVANYGDNIKNTATGEYSHAEGSSNSADGECSHAEGYGCSASRYCSHAEGENTIANGLCSHAEGSFSSANGDRSHAEGEATIANGWHSHAEGKNTIANGACQHVQGRYNKEDGTNGWYAHIVGNGTDDDKRSNAHTLDWSGNAWFAGDVFVNGSGQNSGVKLLKTGEAIQIPLTASVGQVLVVKAVDENGKPTEWETVDFSEQVQSDWEQNDDSSKDYIKNRPFYINETLQSKNELTLTNGKGMSNVYFGRPGSTATIDVHVVIKSNNITMFDLTGTAEFIGGMMMEWMVASLKGTCAMYPSSTVSCEWRTGNWLFEIEGVDMSRLDGTYTVYYYSMDIKQISDRLIPDTIARTSDIPAALPNPNAMKFTGAVTGSYDGSNPLTVNVPSLTVDNSLTQSGQAADAATVGNRLNSLSEEIADRQEGVGIQSVEQTTTSTEDGGTNVIKVTKTDGTFSTFAVRNGSRGSVGPAGADGQPGADGKDGLDGAPGADGKSAYQYAQDGGFTGTEAEFADKLAVDVYSKEEVDAALGAYITDVAALVGGDA